MSLLNLLIEWKSLLEEKRKQVNSWQTYPWVDRNKRKHEAHGQVEEWEQNVQPALISLIEEYLLKVKEGNLK